MLEITVRSVSAATNYYLHISSVRLNETPRAAEPSLVRVVGVCGVSTI